MVTGAISNAVTSVTRRKFTNSTQMSTSTSCTVCRPSATPRRYSAVAVNCSATSRSCCSTSANRWPYATPEGERQPACADSRAPRCPCARSRTCAASASHSEAFARSTAGSPSTRSTSWMSGQAKVRQTLLTASSTPESALSRPFHSWTALPAGPLIRAAPTGWP